MKKDVYVEPKGYFTKEMLKKLEAGEKSKKTSSAKTTKKATTKKTK